jgi:hypothetical protein
MEETVTLKSVETKTTRTGTPMWTALTNVGKMSVFDKLIAEDLFTLVNKNIVVDVETKNNYKNIVRIIRVATNQTPMQTQEPVKNPRLTSASMCISYAKDLCVAGKIELKDINSKAKELLSLYEEMLEIKFV